MLSTICVILIALIGIIILICLFGKTYKALLKAVPAEACTQKGRYSIFVLLLFVYFGISSGFINYLITILTPVSVNSAGVLNFSIDSQTICHFIGLAVLGNLFIIAAE